MQFTNFSRLEEGLTITLYNTTPIENVLAIKYYSDNSAGEFEKKEFRWSFNNIYWSSWETLTQSAISNVDIHDNYFLFLQIRYILSAEHYSGTVSTFTLNYTASTATVVTPGKASALIDASLLNGYSGAWYRDRAHHTGSQPIASVTGLQSILNQVFGTGVIKDSSIGYGLVWNAGMLDVSIYMNDASMNYLYDYNVIQDISIMTINASMDNIYTKPQIDASFALKSTFTGSFLADGLTVNVVEGIIISVVV